MVGREGARLARAIESARWEAEVARVGREKAGDPPWGTDAEGALSREVPDSPEPEPERASAVEGSQLRALREAAGLSQAGLAARIAPGAGMTAGAAQRALSRLERGEGGPRAVLDAAVAVFRPVPLGNF